MKTHSHILSTKVDNTYNMIKILLDYGADKTIKDDSGRYALDFITQNDAHNKKSLIKLLYVEGSKICDKNGKLLTIYHGVDLPLVNKFEDYLKSGIDAIKAFDTKNKEVLDFFLSCGAEIESLKSCN